MEDVPYLLANPVAWFWFIGFIVALAVFGFYKVLEAYYMMSRSATTAVGRTAYSATVVALLCFGLSGFLMMGLTVSSIINLSKYGVPFHG